MAQLEREEDRLQPGSAEQASNGQVPPPSMPPFAISGLVITEAAMLAVLQGYVQHVTDIQMLPGGDQFVLVLATEGDAERRRGAV